MNNSKNKRKKELYCTIDGNEISHKIIQKITFDSSIALWGILPIEPYNTVIYAYSWLKQSKSRITKLW